MALTALMWPRFSATRMIGDRGDEQHGVDIEDRRGEVGRAEPGGVGDAREIDRLAQAHAVGQHRVDDARDDEAHQDQQPLRHAAREDRDAGHADEGHALHPGVKGGGGHVLDRDAGQVQADHGDHGAGHHRWHQALDPAVPVAITIRPMAV